METARADNFADRMEGLGACGEAVQWLRETGYDARAAWEACERGDWMFWMCQWVGVDRRLLLAAACRCWRAEAQQFVPAGELRPLRAIETAEAWTRGEATADECREAAAAAYAYADDADDDEAAGAADAADAASAAASAAARAAANDDDDDAIADYVAYATDAAIYGDYAAYTGSAAARAAVLSRMARIVREAIPWDAVEAALDGQEVRT